MADESDEEGEEKNWEGSEAGDQVDAGQTESDSAHGEGLGTIGEETRTGREQSEDGKAGAGERRVQAPNANKATRLRSTPGIAEGVEPVRKPNNRLRSNSKVTCGHSSQIN